MVLNCLVYILDYGLTKKDEHMELKPCPFCGDIPKSVSYDGEGCHWIYSACGASMRCELEDINLAIKAWNRRQPTGIEPLDEEKVLEVIRKWNYGFSTTDTEEALYQLKKAICSRFGTPKERLVEWPEITFEKIRNILPPNTLNGDEIARTICRYFGTRPEGK